ncbi:MAG: Nif11-like leader peptide family RiPP precursor [Proteobacteria bacterium]|nr:Nif11-like leader peptide family RiPP precursor [Pseudomonadota bacterium]
MSIENAKALLAKASNDPELFEILNSADNEGFEQIAKEAGFPCKVEDVHEVLKSSEERTDEELDSVVGGTANVYRQSYNDLNKFRRLPPGSTLIFPPIIPETE